MNRSNINPIESQSRNDIPQNKIDRNSQSWRLAKIALITSAISLFAGSVFFFFLFTYNGGGGEPSILIEVILYYSLILAAVVSSPIYFISFRKNKNWLNISGLIVNGIIISLAIIISILSAVSEINYDRQAKQDEQQIELEHSQWRDLAFNESELKLEAYYSVNKKYPANFCDADNDSNISCGELDVNDNDTQQEVNFNDADVYWKSLYYVVSEQGEKYELCASGSQSCVSKIDGKRE